MKDNLLVERKTRRPHRLQARKPPSLHIAQILAWADAHHARTGRWPLAAWGYIPGATGEKWSRVDGALRNGLRGLPGGSSLARLLAEQRGKRNPRQLPPHTIKQILAWADAHHARTGRWPRLDSGPIAEAPGETWMAVAAALSTGSRGLPGGSTLRRLLARRRGVRNQSMLPPLSIEQILAWADGWLERTGRWPEAESGDIPATNGEKWSKVDGALRNGLRGLPDGSSLARLLAKHRGKRNPSQVPPLTIKRILAWADAHHARTGRWPRLESGPIAEAPGETWTAVGIALYRGSRGLPGGSTLPRLLAGRRGVRLLGDWPPLSEKQVLRWADAHHRRTGHWPTLKSGPIEDAPGEIWLRLDWALRYGRRGLPRGSTLSRLLARRRGVVKQHRRLPPLTIEQILGWADAHCTRTGRWPNHKSGRIAEAPSETWGRIYLALKEGRRGLPGGRSLARLLAEHRGVRTGYHVSDLSVEQILAWADAHHRRTGNWPTSESGSVHDAPGQTWNGIAVALH
ncbi:MAG: hypothetical protein WD229_12330, partial [Pirellulales bacterium]